MQEFVNDMQIVHDDKKLRDIAVGKMLTSRYFGGEIFWKVLGKEAPSLGPH
jgi:hypothetical protein